MTDLQFPAWLVNRPSRGIAQQLRQSLPTGNVPYLSIKGGAFTLIDAAGNDERVGAMDPKLGLYVDVCVVDSNAHVSRIYYGKEYDPNAEAFMPPTCFSDNGVAPSSQAVVAQHKDCKSCPHSEWDTPSRLTGKNKPACQSVQKVAIVFPDRPNMLFLLRVPPGSLKHLGKYVQEISSFSAGDRRVDIADLITRIYFQPGATGVLGFTAAGWVDAQTAEVADKVWSGKLADQILGKNDQPYTGEIGVPQVGRPVQEHVLPPPSPLMQQLQASVAAPPPAEEAPKRRGRPRKEDVPSSTLTPPQAENGQTEPVPPFLQRIESAPGMPAPRPATPSFGMQAPAAAPDDMQARIAAVLAMKTGNG